MTKELANVVGKLSPEQMKQIKEENERQAKAKEKKAQEKLEESYKVDSSVRATYPVQAFQKLAAAVKGPTPDNKKGRK